MDFTYLIPAGLRRGWLPSINIALLRNCEGYALVRPGRYTGLLKRLVQLASDALEDLKDCLTACIQRVHDHLTLDPTITPHTLL